MVDGRITYFTIVSKGRFKKKPPRCLHDGFS